MQQDPFDVVKASVSHNLVSAKASLDNWAAQGHPLHVAHNARSSLNAIAADINDLAETILVVQREPARFRLTAADIQARRSFVATAKESLKELQSTLESGMVAAEKQQRAALFNTSGHSPPFSASKPPLASGAGSNDPNQNLIDNQLGQQQVLMRNQDQQLDQVMNTVSTLKQVAITMGDEIEDQIGLMNDMDHDVDNTQDKLRGAMRRMDHLMKASNDTKATWLIIVLTITLILLIVFVLV
ncbi:hypothetical protein BCR44DRAFT_153097 [Catenaria anguillulae PL171]|uniref:t-SNARE coiled-coil homology domain-containing protein n=1 Tax=Catenaria anguillulae PL171 TaxID=765915 RepID=A0A1Y2HHZ3_9FUNG|nr:hypothetical protein BCR44DRAFT_153097 [Catenaria anguillulae PL171]